MMQDTRGRVDSKPKYAGNLRRSPIPDNAPGFDRDTMTRKVLVPIGPQTPEDEKANPPRIAYLTEVHEVTEDPKQGVEERIDWWHPELKCWVNKGRKIGKEDPDVMATTREAQGIVYSDDLDGPKYVGTPGSKLQRKTDEIRSQLGEYEKE